MLRQSVNDAHEERPGVHIQAVYGLTVRAVWQFTHNVRTNRVCRLNFLSVCRSFMQFCTVLLPNAASLLTGLHFCTYIFYVITMSLFGLQVCSGNYQKITNTNAAAKNRQCTKTGHNYFL